MFKKEFMRLLRKYIVAIIAGVLVLIVVIFRLSDWNRFTKNAGELNAEISGRTNIISLKSNTGNLPVIDIRSAEVFMAGHPEGATNIPMDNLLSEESRKTFSNNNKGIILFSNDFAMLSRAWSVLSHMGYRNIFIATDGIETDEVLKYKFRPDSTVGGK